jgi:hypothetical protein
MEMILAMAPQASLVVYEENTGNTVSLTAANNQFNADLILAALAQPVPGTSLAPSVIASSWTWNSMTTDTNLPQYFLHFAAQGQSFFQAAGDLGAYVTGDPLTTIPDPIADSVLMTVVGGTTVLPEAPGVTSEVTWNNPNERTTNNSAVNCTSATLSSGTLASGGCSSVTGGGVSSLAIPTYQANVNTSNSTLSTTNRMIPDVSMVADSLASFTAGSAGCSQGTSASVALWAGYAAITNELSSGVGAVGFANPELYFLASSKSNYTLDFKDVTSAANGYGTVAGFSAVTGYDLATGLGTPQPSTCSLVSSLPTQSCMSATSVTTLVQAAPTKGGTVTAYVPAGSYSEAAPNVFAVQIEAPPTQTQPFPYNVALTGPVPITTNATSSDPGPTGGANPAINGSVINTCAANPQTNPPTVVCASNGKTVWVINAQTNVASPLTNPNVPEATAGGVPVVEQFTGQTCSTCNVAIDTVHQVAYLSVATGTDDGTDSTGAAFQTLNLATNTFGSLIQLSQEASSEDIVVDPLRGFILSPNEGFYETGETGGPGDYQLVNTSTGGVFNFSNTGGPISASGGGFDSAAEDCTTGVALSSDEFTNEIFLVDLNQALFNNPSAGLWTSGTVTGTSTTPGFSFFTLSEFALLTGTEAGASAIVVAPSSHIAVVAGEFGGSTFAVLNLPATAGGTPTIGPYVVANIPNTPGDGLAWEFGADPHTLTAYQSPNSGTPYAVFEDDVDVNTTADGLRTYLAIVDLNVLANAHTNALSTRLGAGGVSSNTITLTAADTCTSLVPTTGTPTGVNPPGCIIRFVGNPSPGGL